MLLITTKEVHRIEDVFGDVNKEDALLEFIATSLYNPSKIYTVIWNNDLNEWQVFELEEFKPE